MASKCLVIIVGHNYLNPLSIIADAEVLVQKFAWESKNNQYIYSIYTYNDKYDYYVPYGTIFHGRFSDKEGARVDGIRIHR